MSRPPRVTLRGAVDDDAGRLLEWRNDMDAVRFSVSGRPVTAEDHRRWFAARRDDPQGRLWIAEDGGTPVGQVRVDINDGVGVVSVAVAAEHRGRRIGSEMLRAMVAEVSADGAVRTLRALVHPENGPSIRAFERAGFQLTADNDRGFRVLERRFPG
jgi:UDP-2,4-diacetamido-2,4,6-trideoxy-beta-L-altropyranose hydrolase